MKQLKVGIVGQGRSGYDIHAANLARLPENYRIVAICDDIIERCNDAKERFGAIVYPNYKQMVTNEDLDIVINTSYSHQHTLITLDLLDMGCNVVTEKPLARKVEEVDRIIEKVKQCEKFFAVFQQSRFAPYYRKAKEIADSGILGRILMVKIYFNGFGRRWDWQTIQDYYGGNLLNTGPHPLDQALQFIGTDEIPEVLCIMDRTENTVGDAEDHVKLILRRNGHPSIDIEISSSDAYPENKYQIYGTLGGLSGNHDHLKWKYYKPEEAPKLELHKEPLPDRKYCSEELAMYEEEWNPSEEEADLFKTITTRYYRALYDSFVNNKPFEIKLEEVRTQIAIIEECHRQNPLSKFVNVG